MNAELLLEHFHRLGDATDAVPRLRHFILDLAVRGKLVEHEPGSAFVYLSELCTSRSGNSTIIKGKISAEPGEGLYPAFSASGQDVWHSSYEHEGDAVIVSAVGARCGKAFLATGKWSAIANTHILFPKADRCTLSYLHLIANNEALWIRGGSAQPFVRVSKTLEAREVYLPTFPEQHRIVAKVEELMALCDRLEAAQQQREAERTRLTAAAWQAVVQAEAPAEVSFALEQLSALTTRPAQVKALRQTILDLAVRGRLTKVPISQLEKETKPFNVVADPSRPIAYGVLKPGPHDPNGIRLVKSQHIRGWRVAEEIQDRITPELDAEFKRTKLQGGEVLLNLVGASIGRSAVAPQSLRGSNVSRAVAVIAVAKDVLADFVVILISALLTPERIAQEATGTAQPVLNLGTLRKLDVWLPPLAEQRRIVAKVEELMALCDGLEAALEAGEALRGKVLEAVVGREPGGTEPPTPVPVRQLPVPKVRAPRYEAAEVELAVAAEPVGHAGAMQALVRRGPGRPPKNGAITSTAARAIEAFLQAHPGWHGKAAILEATGVNAGAWNAAVKELLDAGKVERQGEKKGARYRGR